MRLSEIMTTDVATLGPEATLREAVALMLGRRVGGLPVVDEEDRLRGIVTESDLLHRAELGTGRERFHGVLAWLFAPGRAAADYVEAHTAHVADLMTRDVAVLGPEAEVSEAVVLMERRRVRRLPVVDGSGRVIGIVARSDILRVLQRALERRNGPPQADDAIRKAILAELRRQSWSGGGAFRVGVRDGVVTIDGTIGDERCRRAAIVLAQGVEGVVQVVDRLQILTANEWVVMP